MECSVIKVSGHSHSEIFNKNTNFQIHNNNGSLKQHCTTVKRIVTEV